MPPSADLLDSLRVIVLTDDQLATIKTLTDLAHLPPHISEKAQVDAYLSLAHPKTLPEAADEIDEQLTPTLGSYSRQIADALAAFCRLVRERERVE